MNINVKHRRGSNGVFGLRWAAALACAAAAFTACGSDPPERSASEAAADAPVITQRAEVSDRQLQTPADRAAQPASYEHLDREAEARAEQAA